MVSPNELSAWVMLRLVSPQFSNCYNKTNAELVNSEVI